MGAVDSMTHRFSSDDEDETAFKLGLVFCSINIGVTNEMLVELLDGAYQRNPDRWGTSPSFVFWMATVDLCRNTINEEREKRNLPPLQSENFLK